VQQDGSSMQHGVLLLEHVIETLKATPGVTRIEAQLPHFSFDDLAPFFRRHHFETYLRRFMALPLKSGATHRPHSIAPQAVAGAQKHAIFKEFLIEPWQRRHDHEASRLLAEVYRGHVDAAINDQYKSLSGSARLIENIVYLRGCGENLAEASFAAIHRPTGRVAGVLALTAVRLSTAHIPQIAVASAFQRCGLGVALLESSFRELDRLGFEEVSLTVTDHNAGAMRFYERLGFETFHTFGAYVWDGAAERL